MHRPTACGTVYRPMPSVKDAAMDCFTSVALHRPIYVNARLHQHPSVVMKTSVTYTEKRESSEYTFPMRPYISSLVEDASTRTKSTTV